MRSLVRLGIALLLVLFGLVSYCANTVENPITGEKQRVQLSAKQEVALGLRSAPQMASQHGGLYPDQTLQQYVDQVGIKIVKNSEAQKSGYPFDFHLLRDPQTINAFALPGGQVFLTAGLLKRLSNEAQLAGVLGHEIGHVVARHGAEHLAKQQLGQTLVTAVGVAASDQEGRGAQAAAIAAAVNQLVSLRYGRDDELESDKLGLRFITEAGYDPRGILELMKILGSARQGGSPPEFFSTHPNPDNRLQRLQTMINQQYPNGIPPELQDGRDRFAQIVPPRL
ncbi:M48 family metalloprotease [Pantanalinema sp. GBBB05]|uniref:M48 family metalloprotease n=1 Tax=Pantanalinema sp. GBBB05 TaxID=2604139 RepID=UPI001DDDC284|nr:M48 family metalloprotease [Pantanalinema sp. GBBB05]